MRTNCEGGRREILTKDPSLSTLKQGGSPDRGGTVIIKCIREIFRNERVSPPIDVRRATTRATRQSLRRLFSANTAEFSSMHPRVNLRNILAIKLSKRRTLIGQIFLAYCHSSSVSLFPHPGPGGRKSPENVDMAIWDVKRCLTAAH